MTQQPSQAALEDLIGRYIHDRYRLVRLVAQGGMGAIFEAVHDETRHRAAVKVLYPELAREPRWIERLFKEAQAVNVVEHPGLVKIFSCGYLEDDQALGPTGYILMEYLDGDPLWRRLVRQQRVGQPFSIDDTLRIGRQVASALATVHRKGIIHRDLKPENVLLIRDPEVRSGERVKLLDFGVAKFVDPSFGVHPTTVDRVVGTPSYMSPEQCRGGTLDGKSDVYGLGIMLYELLAGRLPFEHTDAVSLMAMHLRDEPGSLGGIRADVPGALAALVHEMLRKDSVERPSMMEVESRLAELEEEDLPGTIPMPAVVPVSIDNRGASRFAIDNRGASRFAIDGAPPPSALAGSRQSPRSTLRDEPGLSTGSLSRLLRPSGHRAAAVVVVGVLLSGGVGAAWLHQHQRPGAAAALSPPPPGDATGRAGPAAAQPTTSAGGGQGPQGQIAPAPALDTSGQDPDERGSLERPALTARGGKRHRHKEPAAAECSNPASQVPAGSEEDPVGRGSTAARQSPGAADAQRTRPSADGAGAHRPIPLPDVREVLSPPGPGRGGGR